MTIDDDDDTFKAVEEEEEEEESFVEATPEPAKKKRKTDKAAKKASASKNNEAKTDTTGDQFNPNFSFAVDGGGSVGPNHAWDFTAARNMLKEKQVTHNRHPMRHTKRS